MSATASQMTHAPTTRRGPLYRLSVDQYLEMIRSGILTDEDRVELLEGVLVAKMSKDPPHLYATRAVFAALTALMPAGWLVFKEDALQLPTGVPEPDCAVVRGTNEDYADRLPGPADVALIVEVADSSLRRDRRTKARIYARTGIAESWIVNLVDRRVEGYTGAVGLPDAPSYASCEPYGPGQDVPVILDGHEVGRVTPRDILPPA